MTDFRERPVQGRSEEDGAGGEAPLPTTLEAALRAPPAGRAPEWFSAGVMARVRAAGQAPHAEGAGRAAGDAAGREVAGEDEAAGAALARRLRRGLLATWALAMLSIGTLAWLSLGPLASSLAAEAGPEGGWAAEGAALEGWLAGLGHRLAAASPTLLTLGSLAAAAGLSFAALRLARLIAARAAWRTAA